MQDFQIGQDVEFTTHASGYSEQRTGKILAIIPAGAAVGGFIPHRFKLKDNRPQMSRTHRSYLVIPDGARRRIMWPVVSQLRARKLVNA